MLAKNVINPETGSCWYANDEITEGGGPNWTSRGVGGGGGGGGGDLDRAGGGGGGARGNQDQGQGDLSHDASGEPPTEVPKQVDWTLLPAPVATEARRFPGGNRHGA